MENKKSHSLCLEAFLMCQNIHKFKYSVTLGIFDGKIGNMYLLSPLIGCKSIQLRHVAADF